MIVSKIYIPLKHAMFSWFIPNNVQVPINMKADFIFISIKAGHMWIQFLCQAILDNFEDNPNLNVIYLIRSRGWVYIPSIVFFIFCLKYIFNSIIYSNDIALGIWQIERNDAVVNHHLKIKSRLSISVT